MSRGITIYVVDPDVAIGDALSTLIATYDAAVQLFSDAETVLASATLWDIECGCLMTDANLPGMSGLSLLRRLRAQGFALPMIVFTNTFTDEMRRQALAFGATDVIDKRLINAFLMERLSEYLPSTQKLSRVGPDRSADPSSN